MGVRVSATPTTAESLPCYTYIIHITYIIYRQACDDNRTFLNISCCSNWTLRNRCFGKKNHPTRAKSVNISQEAYYDPLEYLLLLCACDNIAWNIII